MDHDVTVLGLDAGGTSTRAVLVSGSAECLGYGVGGRGNPTSAGPERAADGVMEAITRALAASETPLSDVAVITASMAGKRARNDDDWLVNRLAAHGFAGRLTFESDLLAAYYSGSAEPFGYALVSGTGACVIRVAGGNIEDTGDGLGWLLGDRGSGFWIGRRVARAVVQDLDGTGPATTLTPAVIEALGLQPQDTQNEGRSNALELVVSALYSRPPIELASLAILAFADDDPVAVSILRRAGIHLADTLSAVYTTAATVVVGGSVLARSGPVRDAFDARLGPRAAALDLRLVSDGTVGAGLLALRAAGVPPTPTGLQTLTSTLARHR